MYGIRVHQAVIDAGVRVTGVTVHFVDEQYDRGPIIAQWPVPVLPDDTPDILASRVLAVEHTLYPATLDAVARGRVTLGVNGRVVAPSALPDWASIAPPSLSAFTGS
jgi:folate-dependent phosphoribosylglycinamide formyltransferase PurN